MRRRLLLAGACGALLTLHIGSRAATNDSKVVNDGYGDFVLVPAGSFRMGDNFGDGESRERPVHAVDLDAMSLGGGGRRVLGRSCRSEQREEEKSLRHDDLQ